MDLKLEYGVPSIIDVKQQGVRSNVKLFVDPETMPQDGSINRLEELAAIPGLFGDVVALPEIHYKAGYVCPTGAVIASKNYVMPSLIPITNNCGMRVFLTPLTYKDINASMIDKFYTRLKQNIFHGPNGTYSLTRKDTEDIFTSGCEWGINRFELDRKELLNIENQGNMFLNNPLSRDDILKNIPRACYKISEMGLDYMGGGNHFIEMQRVSNIFDVSVAERLKIKKDQIIFMMHSDAGPVGGIIGQYFSAFKMPGTLISKAKSTIAKSGYHLRRMRSLSETVRFHKHVFKGGYVPTIHEESSLGKRYVASSYAVSNFGYLKRMYLTEVVRKVLREVVGDKNMECPLIYDLAHVLIQKEKYGDNNIWVHRQGGCRAYPKDKMGWHDVYKDTGQPFPLPSSMATPSYICIATEGAKNTFYTSCHGTGDVTKRVHDLGGEEELRGYLKAKGIKIFHMKNTKITKHNPKKYKTAKVIINTLKAFDIAKPVCKANPIASLKE